MNYATPPMVRSLEWIGALAPDLPHVYLTSSRDESIDKAFRLLKVNRKAGRIAIGLGGGYYGHTIASCRSLSDPSVHAGGPSHFAWPSVPHPAVAGVEGTIAALRAAVTAAGGPDKVLGFFYEIVQERTGQVLPDGFGPALDALRKELDLPLVAVETTTSMYRSGLGAFASARGNARAPRPDVLTWWGGGQTGYLHVASRWLVATALTLVSTWDGDELSLVRNHHQLRAARAIDIAAGSRALDEALAGRNAHGLGLYRVLDGNDTLARGLTARGISVRVLPSGKLAIIPALDAAVEAATRLGAALKEIDA
jgi:acetylornithine/succinyldiaminopimelate/putrescine aminotransferase